MMQNTTVRLTVVIAAALVVHLGYLFVRSSGMPTDFRPLQRELKELPMTLGEWKGEDREVDPEITGIMDADEWADRIYQDPEGNWISLHFNAVKQYFFTLQHHPKHCYQSHGSRVVEEKTVQLKLDDDSSIRKLDDDPSIRVASMVVESDGQESLVYYWYQLDAFRENNNVEILLNHVEQRKLRLELRGQDTWPPLIKVLLQTPIGKGGREKAEKRMKEFAARVYQWTKFVDRPKPPETDSEENATP